jgi:hypothetical protein
MKWGTGELVKCIIVELGNWGNESLMNLGTGEMMS